MLFALQPAFDALGNVDLLIFFVGIVGVCIFAGVPIAFAFAIATFGYMYFTSTIPLSVVIGQMDQGMSSIELLAVPMFVVLGLLLEMTGIARAMVDFLAALVGRRRGGLSYVLIAAMYLISGISGSKAADQAAVAPVLLPEMRRRGQAPGELAAQLAASAAMSETIPPSLVLIIVGAVTGVSISALFTGGLLPAGIAALGLALLVFVRTRGDTPDPRRVPAREIGRLLLVALPALILPFVIRYFVLAGITTATEVATVGVVYSVLVGLFVYRCFYWRRLVPILVETAALSGAILLIIGSASAMAWALTQAGFAQTLTDMMTGLPGGKAGFLAISIVVFVVLGSVLEGLAGDGAVRAAAVSRGAAARHPSRAIRDRGDPRDGDRPVLAALRRRLLPDLPDQPRAERRGVRAHLALYGDAHRGARGGGSGAVDLDGLPALSAAAARQPRSISTMSRSSCGIGSRTASPKIPRRL